MARLNTTRTQAKEEPRRRTGLKDNSAQPESLGQARPLQDRSSKGSTHKKHSSGTFFDIFPDSVQTHEDENDDVQYKSSPSLPSRKQKTKRTLKAAPVNSLLLPLQHRRRQRPNTKAGTDDYDKENDLTEDTMDSYSVEASPQPSPRRNAEQTPERSRLQDRPMSRLSLESRGSDEEDCGNDTFNSIDDFVVSDNDEISYHETSGSETDEPESPPPPPPKSARKRLLRGRRPGTTNIGAEDNAKKDSSPLRSPCVDDRSSVEDKITPSSSNSPGHMSQDDGQLVTKLTELALEEDLQDVDDKGYTSPQPEETRSPSVIEPSSHPELKPTEEDKVTPPSSPSPSRRLVSPRKERTKIPPTPHRESVDAFWSQEETNNWNDKYSPRKPKKEKSMIEILQEFDNSDGEGSSQDSGSGLEPIPMARVKAKEPKAPSKTALKKAEAEAKRAEKALRQAFEDKKIGLAKAFLHDLDVAVTGGKIIQLAEETGGVEIVWSKTLQKTAGRATWKATHGRSSTPLHYAKIELADRILVDEYRLTNTLTHEYCHLANYMISKVVDQPHGPSFKSWGMKCADAMKNHPQYGGQIHVTTKHSYKIDYKYVWACVNCGCQFGRHSKSLDTTRFSCGTCKGKLEQIKPKPRAVSPKKNGAVPNFQKKTLAYEKLTLDEVKL